MDLSRPMSSIRCTMYYAMYSGKAEDDAQSISLATNRQAPRYTQIAVYQL